MKKYCESILPPDERAKLDAQLKRHEGCRLSAYQDSEGILTIGFGHNCEAWPLEEVKKAGDIISLEQAELLFRNDVSLAEGQTGYALPWLDTLVYARRAVLINMVFNMGLGSVASGQGLMGFRRMLAAIQSGDYTRAAREMLDSRWARQVGRRAQELSEQMASGEWPDYLKAVSHAGPAS